MCPSRWLTPMRGAPVARAMALAPARPTRRAPTRPGPTVTAMPSRAGNRRPARARASSTSGDSTSTCAREASSGTTPPNRPCMSIWLATRLTSTSVPSSTIATAVSSQEVSIPRTFNGRAPSLRVLGRAGHDLVQELLVLRRVHVVHPHDQGVLAGLLVVVLAHPDGPEPEPPVQPLGAPVRHPDLQRHGAGPHLDGRLDQLVEQPGPDLAAMVLGVDGDGGHVGLVAVADHASVADHVATDPGHQVGPVGGFRHLGQEQAGAPRARVHLALDRHHAAEVEAAHPADLELSRSWLFCPKRSPHPTSSGTAGPRPRRGRILPCETWEWKARRAPPRSGTRAPATRNRRGSPPTPARDGTASRRPPRAGRPPPAPPAPRPAWPGSPPCTRWSG